MDSNLCPACGWTDLPDFPKAFPEDGDKPLLVEAPYDGLYDLYLMSKVDFYNREADNYNNSALAYNARWTNGGNSITAGTCPSAAGV